MSHLLDPIKFTAHFTILVLIVKVVLSFIVVNGPPASVVVACRDAEDHSTPFVQDPLCQILHLRHTYSIFCIDFHSTSKFRCVLKENCLNVKRVNRLKNFLHNFHIWVRSIREWI